MEPPEIDPKDWPRTIKAIKEWLRRCLGMTNIPLAYVIRDSEDPQAAADDPPTNYSSIQDEMIANYQMVVPTTWNASPRDSNGQRSAYEASLIGTPVSDPEKPLEILRTVHSFDPCIACAVHLYDKKGRHVHQIRP